MKEELYIKGEAVDLGDAQIALNFKSNILGDISKITASNSYTIELPRTLKNERLLEFPDVAGHESYLARDYFDAQYFRNGIKILDAKAVITSSSSDGFSLALTWGIDEKLENIINDDRSIQEFAHEALFWGQSSQYDYGTQDGNPIHGYIPMNTGVDVDSLREKVFVHPSASVKRILEEIEGRYEIGLNFPANVQEDLDLLYIPLVTQNADPTYNFYSAKLASTLMDFSIKMEELQKIDGAYLFQGTTYQPYSVILSNTSHDWKVVLNSKLTSSTGFVVIAFYTEQYQKINEIRVYAGENNKASFNDEIPFDISAYNSVRVSVYVGGNSNIDYTSTNTISLVDMDLSSIHYNQYYPIGKNLPNIKVVDFIKEICWLFGLFAVRSNEGIDFVSVGIFQTNKAKAVDWSKKLVPAGRTAKETTYQFGDFAQKNYLRYKENENAKSADGYLPVADKTLESETDLIELSFQAGGDNGDMNAVPYFKMSDDGTNVELVSCEDRIMKLTVEQIGQYPKLSFRGLSFQEIIPKYYKEYENIINNVFVIKDDFRLTDIDLKNLDMTVPVYIQQYGSFFAIVSIKTQGEISEGELLKLK